MEDRAPTPGQADSTRPETPVATRRVTAPVPDLGRALDYFADAAGMTPAPDVELHTDVPGQLWRLPGARAGRALVAAGDLVA